MDNAATMRRAYELINAGDVAGFGDLVSADFVEHEEIPGLPPTKDGMLTYFRSLLVSFPDLRMQVDDLIGDDDKTVARVTVTGTHQGEFMGAPPTGNRVEMQLIDIMQFDAAGLIAAHWGVTDMLSLLQQVGLLPAAPPA